MEIKSLNLDGVFEVVPHRIDDARGYFMEAYSRETFARLGLQTEWVQENQSLSVRRHTLRGLHFQIPPFAQAKLIRVIRGEILDVFVDLRQDSSTFGKWDSIVLSEENLKSVYIPRGFAHGFCTLMENTVVQYKIDNFYSREHECGIRWNDPEIGIQWKVDNPFLSDKDSALPFFKDFNSLF